MTGTKTLEKAVAIFKLAIDKKQPRSAKEIAALTALPVATVYRHLAVFEKQGLIRRNSHGTLGPGADLVALVDQTRLYETLASTARPILEKVSRKLRMISQLGIFENDMVTYLVKSEPEGQSVFTRENEQLEAYCTGIGKLLLSELPKQELDAYLGTGPFPAITDHTLTEPEELRQALSEIRENGYAIDNAEMDPDLFCLAVPLRNLEGDIIAGLSASCRGAHTFEAEKDRMRDQLTGAVAKLREALYGKWIRTSGSN